MQIREHELMQFEALGQIDDARIESLSRTWARPRAAKAPRTALSRSMPELEQLALPAEGWGPRLA
ncbi:MAG: hypothetical protein M3Y87_34010 [Myxococcota bacterium]|nr:hypothetical protein [Myxococcota bacterium]